MGSVLEQAMTLNTDQKLQLISDLWDSLDQSPKGIPVPPWQLDELERRIESQRVDPQIGQSWADVKREILDGK